jgi:hypothetical protein
MTEKFETKDSGNREQFESGMVRDTQEGKTQFDLMLDGPIPLEVLRSTPKGEAVVSFCAWRYSAENTLYDVSDMLAVDVIKAIAEYEGGVPALMIRYAELMTRGAVKYSARNWMKASGEAERKRFIASATRHFFQWYAGNRDEDHAAAVVFNLNGFEYVNDKLVSGDEVPF